MGIGTQIFTIQCFVLNFFLIFSWRKTVIAWRMFIILIGLNQQTFLSTKLQLKAVLLLSPPFHFHGRFLLMPRPLHLSSSPGFLRRRRPVGFRSKIELLLLPRAIAKQKRDAGIGLMLSFPLFGN